MKKLLLFMLCPFFLFGQTQIGADIDGEATEDNSGNSISLSSDGSIVAISARYNSGNGSSSGHVRIFENNNGVWEQIGVDIDGEAALDHSGSSVNLSSDGSIVAIGAINNDGNGSSSGHVRIYKNNNGVWEQVGADIDGKAIGHQSGYSVSLSSDGSIVAIGGDGFDGQGSVSIYKNNNAVWEQIGVDINGEVTNDAAFNVDLSSDGSIIAIGAAGSDGNGNNSGRVRIYNNNNSVWQQIGADINGEAAEDLSGSSLSLNFDGTIVAIGAGYNDGNGSGSGHVRIYNNNNGVWEQIGADIDGEAAGDSSGSVSLSSDGSIVAIGAFFNDGNGSSSGHVRIYNNNNSVWEQIGVDIDGEAASDFSGISVSLSTNGSIVAIGAVGSDGNGSNSGHVRVYDLSAVLSSDEFVLSQFKLFPNPAKNKVTIKLQPGLELEELLIYNNLGQQIIASKNLVIDTSDLNAGIYYLQIKTDKGNGTKKMIIK